MDAATVIPSSGPRGRIMRLDDLRHRAMCVTQAPNEVTSVRDLANVLQDFIGELIQLTAEANEAS